MHDDSHDNNSSYSNAYRQYSRDQVLESRELEVERKYFRIELKENDRGQFLRITEESQGRRNTVIVPGTGLAEFAKLIHDVVASGGAEE
jgi:hypothetical protein